MSRSSEPRRAVLDRFAGGIVTALLGTFAGCTTGAGSEAETTTLGSDDAARPATESTTTAPPDGPGTLRIENTTSHRIDVRVQIYVKDGPENLRSYVLVDPDSTRVVSYGVEETGTRHVVVTLPTLGDRDVNWTADEQWSVASTTEPETVRVSVADGGLSIEAPSR